MRPFVYDSAQGVLRPTRRLLTGYQPRDMARRSMVGIWSLPLRGFRPGVMAYRLPLERVLTEVQEGNRTIDALALRLDADPRSTGFGE